MVETGALAGAQSSQVKSATRTLDIIEFVVAQGRPMVAQEIATALGIPVSSLSYLLATLVERGYLAREGRRYSAGPGLARLQAAAPAQSLAGRAAPLVRAIRSQLDETTSFFVRVGWEVEALVTECSEQALRYSVSQGHRLPMHALASGKVLLAALEPGELDRYFAEVERDAFTARTLVREKDLRAELASVRRTGFATTDEEYSLGILGIARLVTQDGEAIGSLSVAVPKARLDAALEARIRDTLSRAAALMEAGAAAPSL